MNGIDSCRSPVIRRLLLSSVIFIVECKGQPTLHHDAYQDDACQDEDCVISQNEAINIGGRHFLVRPGGPDIEWPSAAVSGGTVAVAFTKNEADTRILEVATATLDILGQPGDFSFAAIGEIAYPGGFEPHLVGTENGFFLVWNEWHDPPGLLWGSKLDRRGTIIEGPYQETADNCVSFDAVWSGQILAVAYRTTEEEDRYVLKISLSRDTGEPFQIRPIDSCAHTYSAPAVVWDGEAFDVIYECDMATNTIDRAFGLKMVRIGASGDVIARDIILDGPNDEIAPWGGSGPGALWTGSEIALAWFSETMGESGVHFAFFETGGELLAEPEIFEEVTLEYGCSFEIVPFRDGYLVMTKGSCLATEMGPNFAWVCPVNAEGRQEEECTSIAIDETIISATAAGDGVLMFYGEGIGISCYEKTSIFYVSVEYPPLGFSRPEPLLKPASDIRPIRMGCMDGICRIFGEGSTSGFPRRFYLITPFYSWYSVETSTGDVQVYPANFDAVVKKTASGDIADGIGVIWKERETGRVNLSFIDVWGRMEWTYAFPLIVEDPESILAYAENEAVRLIYPCSGGEGRCHAVVRNGLAVEETPLLDVPEHVKGCGGMYYGINDVGYTMDMVPIFRFNPLEDGGFLPFAQAPLYPQDYRNFEIFPAGKFVGGMQWVHGARILQRWDLDGTRLPDCSLALQAGLGFQESLPGENLFIFMYELRSPEISLLWQVDRMGPGNLYSLGLPVDSDRICDIAMAGAPDAIYAALREKGTGNVYLSVWQIP